jgi:hypothetical protein
VPPAGQPDMPIGLIGCRLSVRLLCAKPMDEHHVSSFKYCALIFNSCEVSQCVVKAVTGRAGRNDRTQPTQGPVESSKVFSRGNSDWTRPVTRDLTRPAFGPTTASCVQPVNINRTLTSASGHSVTNMRS